MASSSTFGNLYITSPFGDCVESRTTHTHVFNSIILCSPRPVIAIFPILKIINLPTQPAPQHNTIKRPAIFPTEPQIELSSTMYALLATTLTLLLATTSATPLAKRNIGGIRLCDQINWGGNCWYGIVPLNECIALNSLYVLDHLPHRSKMNDRSWIERHHRVASAGQIRAEQLPGVAIAMSPKFR